MAAVVRDVEVGSLNRITTIHPRTYNEAKNIGEWFRDQVPVIMNLSDMDDADAKRLVDFAAGLVFGLHGTIERVTSKVFLLSPAHVEISADEPETPAVSTPRLLQPELSAPVPDRSVSRGRLASTCAPVITPAATSGTLTDMDAFWTIYGVVVFTFFIALIGRFVIDWVQVLARSWRPTGVVLVVAEAVYTVTDPPLRALRKVIPSPNLGGVRLDLSFLVLMLLTSLALNVPSFF